MYRRILVPLDGSAQAEAAIPYAARIPSERVRLLRVEPAVSDAAPAVGAPSADLERAGAPLVEIGRMVEPAAARGDPAEEIVRMAADADLVVMTTRGHGAGGRLVFGSVADRVARHAPVPTLVVRGGDRPVVPARFVRIVVPLDGSPTAERALPVASRLARLLELPVHCLTVAEVVGVDGNVAQALPAGVYDAGLEAARHQAAERLATAASKLRSEGMTASEEVRVGPVRSELIAALRAGDLVVMTTHGHGRALRWSVGAVAEQVLQRAPGPVLLVRADLGSETRTDW